ncbi:imidazole glycerol phosphate synthase subunit HisF [Candidatus Vidania fulgoroideorum]
MIKRLIVCLDVYKGKVVKGLKFKIKKIFNNPTYLSKLYSKKGIDEIVFLNINKEKIKNICNSIKDISKNINIPLLVGGNIRNLKDVKKIFNYGADRICLNTTLLKNNKIIKNISKIYGAQSIVASIDVKRVKKNWNVFINGGKDDTGIKVKDWCKINEEKGIGEILLTSIDKDGCKKGYDCNLLKYLKNIIGVPIISSGGAGNINDLKKSLNIKGINSALVASIVHEKKYKIKEIKKELSKYYFIR